MILLMTQLETGRMIVVLLKNIVLDLITTVVTMNALKVILSGEPSINMRCVLMPTE
jgi:hypothetical protein